MIRIAKDVLSINLAVMENLAELNEYAWFQTQSFSRELVPDIRNKPASAYMLGFQSRDASAKNKSQHSSGWNLSWETISFPCITGLQTFLRFAFFLRFAWVNQLFRVFYCIPGERFCGWCWKVGRWFLIPIYLFIWGLEYMRFSLGGLQDLEFEKYIVVWHYMVVYFYHINISVICGIH